MEKTLPSQLRDRNITSLNTLLEVFRPPRDTPAQDHHKQFLIFRGQTSSYVDDTDKQLMPSIFRYEDTVLTIEREIYSDFFNLIRMYPPALVDLNSPWELLCYAQHVRVPTRLLDWTINPLIAAYFAVEDGYEDKKKENGKKPDDGIVFVLNVSTYTSASKTTTAPNPSSGTLPDQDDRLGFRGVDIAKLPTDRNFLSYLKRPASGNPEVLDNPEDVHVDIRVIQPPIIDPRIQAQSALFTVDVSDDTGFAHAAKLKGHLFRFTIPAKFKSTIKTQLYRMGIHAGSIYPDIYGLGLYLTDRRNREHWLKTLGTK